MKGYIHIEATKREGAEGLSVVCSLEHVGTLDKFHIMESVCRTLQLTKQECMVFVCLKHDGTLDKIFGSEGIELKLPIKEDT